MYSFGIFLWELCALAKPFASITSSTEFERAVFVGGEMSGNGESLAHSNEEAHEQLLVYFSKQEANQLGRCQIRVVVVDDRRKWQQ
jgi:hypothetical protein